MEVPSDPVSFSVLNHVVNAFKRKLSATVHFSWILNITEEENESFTSWQRLKQQNVLIRLKQLKKTNHLTHHKISQSRTQDRISAPRRRPPFKTLGTRLKISLLADPTWSKIQNSNKRTEHTPQNVSLVVISPQLI